MEASVAVAAIQIVAVVAAHWLSSRNSFVETKLRYIVSVAVGVLVSTALLHILPEAVTSLGNRQALWLVFAGTMFTMFSVERATSAVAGSRAHGAHPTDTSVRVEHRHSHTRSFGVIFGSSLHSLLDGVSVAAAFSAGRQVGWLTAVAITLHEVPHRMGDYALLLHLGLSRGRALRSLLIVAAAAMAGVFVVVAAGHALPQTAWLLPISAGTFVYIALVNMMPELAGDQRLTSVLLQLACILLGATLVGALLRLAAG